MRKYLAFLLTLGLFGYLQAQSLAPEVLASSGSTLTSANNIVDFTVGEPVIQTFSTGQGVLTQGFHQTNLEVVAVDPENEAISGIEVFPNPFPDQFTIRNLGTAAVTGEIYDISGKRVSESIRVNPGEEVPVDANGMSAGQYFLRLKADENTSSTKTFKIVKTQ